MPSHTQNLRTVILFSVLFLLFLLRHERFDPILEEDLRNVSVSIERTKFDLEVEKWKDCMKKNMEMGMEDWYFTRVGVQKCFNQTKFMNVPVEKTSNIVHIKSENTEINVVLIGNMSEKSRNSFPKDTVFYGTHLNSSNIFQEYQRLENYFIDSNGSSSEIMDLKTFLETEKLNGKLIDLLHINLPVSDFTVFEEISAFKICQYSIQLEHPTTSNKKKLIETISKIIADSKFVILFFHDLQIFLVNLEILECRNKYLNKFIN
uniref:Uncharacterized protein n=1 Tax=Caenorhabditis tropicalis TaxID=1561998 RepID=A0A1I7T8L8_9PELO